MMNDFPIYYVYDHVDPTTGEVVYIGHGKFERAWRCSTTNHPMNYGHRSEPHAEQLWEWLLSGYTPNDWVVITDSGLSKTEACNIELKRIHEERPKFNRSIRVKKKLDDVDKKQLEQYRELGLFYHEIANKVGVSTMTVWRYLNG